MTTGGRTRTAGAAVVEVEDPEASRNFDLAAAVRAGARAVRLTSTCHLSAREPLATLAVIRLLREAASDGVPVSWQGSVGDGVDPDLLVHLPPPEPGTATGADPALAEWRARHQPGLCHYRVGPDFVFVKDVRRPASAARFRLEVVNAFRSLEAVVEVAPLDPVTVGTLEDLEQEGLVLRLGGFATLLPNRMRRWPVPALDV